MAEKLQNPKVEWPADKVERWREIPGHPGYEASDAGRVRSVDRVLGDGRRWVGRVLKQQIDRGGYNQVSLATGSRGRFRKAGVHRLVADAFLGPPQTEGHQVAHGDGVRRNNHLCNLRWATARENAEDRDRHGTTAHPKGVAHGMSILTEAAVLEIRAAKRLGVSADELAARFNVSRWTVFDAASGRTWGHI